MTETLIESDYDEVETPEARERYQKEVLQATLVSVITIVLTAVAVPYFGIFIVWVFIFAAYQPLTSIAIGLVVLHLVSRASLRIRIPPGGLIAAAFVYGLLIALPARFASRSALPAILLAAMGMGVLLAVLLADARRRFKRWVTTRSFGVLRTMNAWGGIPFRLLVVGWIGAKSGVLDHERYMHLARGWHSDSNVVVDGLCVAVAFVGVLCSLERVYWTFPASKPTEAAFDFVDSIVILSFGLLTFGVKS